MCGGLIEERGYGIVAAQAEPCAVVRLIVDLEPEGHGARMPDRQELVANLAGNRAAARHVRRGKRND